MVVSPMWVPGPLEPLNHLCSPLDFCLLDPGLSVACAAFVHLVPGFINYNLNAGHRHTTFLAVFPTLN